MHGWSEIGRFKSRAVMRFSVEGGDGIPASGRGTSELAGLFLEDGDDPLTIDFLSLESGARRGSLCSKESLPSCAVPSCEVAGVRDACERGDLFACCRIEASEFVGCIKVVSCGGLCLEPRGCRLGVCQFHSDRVHTLNSSRQP